MQQLIKQLELISEGQGLSLLRELKQELAELCLYCLLDFEGLLNTLDQSVLNGELDCAGTIAQLTRLRAVLTGQSVEQVLANVYHGDDWQDWIVEMQAENEFPAWVQSPSEEEVIEPDVDDSLPDWADNYANESDYIASEYPEFLNPDYA